MIERDDGSFYLRGGSTGIQLVHGFTGTPAEMRELGEYLHGKGMTVSCKLLPGHGVHPRELNRTTWRAWFDTVLETHEELESECKTVFACGLSMGGALALHTAAHRRLSGVITLSGALKPSDWRIFLLPLLKFVLPYDKKWSGEDIRDPGAREEFSGYSVWPTRGVSELTKLTSHVLEDLPEITCPLLVMHARNDHTIPLRDAETIYGTATSRYKRKVILEESWHVITVDLEKTRVMEEIWQFIQDVQGMGAAGRSLDLIEGSLAA